MGETLTDSQESPGVSESTIKDGRKDLFSEKSDT